MSGFFDNFFSWVRTPLPSNRDLELVIPLQIIKPCAICQKRKRPDKQTALWAEGHVAWNSCAQDYLDEQIVEEIYSPRQIPCPAVCSEYVHLELLEKYGIEDINKEEAIVGICEICGLDYEDPKVTCSDGHAFCNECVTSYLQCQIEGKKFVERTIACPGGCCELPIPRALVDRLLSKTEIAAFELALKECDPNAIYCPNEACNHLFILVDLKLSYVFCPRCSNEICTRWKMNMHTGKCASSDTDRIKLALSQQGIIVEECPNDGELVILKKGCKHLNWPTCGTDFWAKWGVDLKPVYAHGNQYHRKDCEYYAPLPASEVNIFNPRCPQCANLGEVCSPPDN